LGNLLLKYLLSTQICITRSVTWLIAKSAKVSLPLVISKQKM